VKAKDLALSKLIKSTNKTFFKTTSQNDHLGKKRKNVFSILMKLIFV